MTTRAPISNHDRLILSAELGAVIVLAILPYTFTALYPGSRGGAGYDFTQIRNCLYACVYALQVMIPTLYIAWRTGFPWRTFGIVPFRFRVDLPLAILIAVLTFVLGVAAQVLVRKFTWLTPFAGPAPGLSGDALTRVIFILCILLSAAAEELVIKSYFLVRMRQWGGTAFAIFMSSALFGLYHTYQGWAAGLEIGLVNCLMAWLYLKVPRLFPFILGHAFYNFFLFWLESGA